MDSLHGLLRVAGHSDKPHPRLLHGSANGTGIGLITLIRLHPRLHILRGNQADRVP
jgi:hypothetical protein